MAEAPSSQEVYITIHVRGKIGHVKSVLFAHTKKENDCENVKEYYKHFYYIEVQALHYQQNMDIPCFIVLCCTELCRYCCTFPPTNWRTVANQHQANLSSPFSPTIFAHFISLYHILAIFTISQKFSLLSLLWWYVIGDFYCYFYKKITTHWSFRWLLALLLFSSIQSAKTRPRAN